MFRTLALLIATTLFTSIHAAPIAASSKSTPPFEITNLIVKEVTGGNVTVSFTVHDPDPLTDETSTCAFTWPATTNAFPQGTYAACGSNTTFAWHVGSYKSIKSFTVGIEHTFEDPSVGKKPYDYVTNFGKVDITKSLSPCTVAGKTTTCKQSPPMIKAPIYATVA